jgi:hypothetical protein
MKIEIKPITKQITSVSITIDIVPNLSKAFANVWYEGLLETKTITIEGAEYDAWGSDDNYIYDLILSKLGLEKA